MTKIIPLNHRAILEISGADRKNFLQGLITNDINKATKDNLIYAVMLNAQGRFLYDFFIFELDDKLILDCFAARRDEILQKLNFYKLRAKVEIRKNDDLLPSQLLEGSINTTPQFPDPRHPSLGLRIYPNKSSTNNQQLTTDNYNLARITNKIPEGELDLTHEKSFILEFGFDDLNAIDYQKGCYVGQELTARTHYRGEIRKKIFHLKIPHKKNIEKGCEIFSGEKVIGEILSSVFHQNELHALALIRLPEGQQDLPKISELDFRSTKNEAEKNSSE